MHNFKELLVWQKARILIKEVYGISSGFPVEERFGLTSQIRSCSVSVISNIAEGSGRGTDKDFCNFLNMSQGSACELETQIIVAYDLKFISVNQFDFLTEKIQEIQRMLIGLRKKLKTE